jgi:pre-mRNA-processing factor 6
VKVWLATADLENGEKARKRVLRRGTTSLRIFVAIFYHYAALEHIPNSVRLWKQTVNLETSPADARTLLSRSVEVIPLSVELWLALARLESPENAKAVLNKARKAVPTSHEIWIAAGRLIEQEAYAAETSEEKRVEELERVDKTLVAAVRALRAHGVLLTREQWLKEAERCEAEGAPRTCARARFREELGERADLACCSQARGGEPRAGGCARAFCARTHGRRYREGALTYA